MGVCRVLLDLYNYEIYTAFTLAQLAWANFSPYTQTPTVFLYSSLYSTYYSIYRGLKNKQKCYEYLG